VISNEHTSSSITCIRGNIHHNRSIKCLYINWNPTNSIGINNLNIFSIYPYELVFDRTYISCDSNNTRGYSISILRKVIYMIAGYSHTKRIIYTYNEEGPYDLGEPMRMYQYQLPSGIPIGNNTVLGTVFGYATDGTNWYLITPSHVAQYLTTTYFPSGLYEYINEPNIPKGNPVPIGTVYTRTPITTNIDLDIALIKLNPNIKPMPYIYNLNAPQFTMDPQFGETIIKVGARTGITEGYVVDPEVTLKILTDSGQEIYFTGSLLFLHSLPGDSGSPIYENGGALVGMLEGGNGIYAIANLPSKINEYLQSNGLKLYLAPFNLIGENIFTIFGSIIAAIGLFL